MSVDEFEQIYDDHKEQQAIHEAEAEMFGAILDDDDILNELDNLVSEQEAQNAPEIVGPGVSHIPIQKPVVQAEEEKEDEEINRRLKVLAAA